MENMDKRNPQYQNENTPNASKIFAPKCLPKLKSLRFMKKGFIWVSVVRGLYISELKNTAD